MARMCAVISMWGMHNEEHVHLLNMPNHHISVKISWLALFSIRAWCYSIVLLITHPDPDTGKFIGTFAVLVFGSRLLFLNKFTPHFYAQTLALTSTVGKSKMASNSKSEFCQTTNKTTNLTLCEVTCPICMYILVEPVTMPCNHELCLKCFKENISETSLKCPMCRWEFLFHI